MYILQIADLHYGSENGTSITEKSIIRDMIEKIKVEIEDGSKILICICGDLIDSKKNKNGKDLSGFEIEERYDLVKKDIFSMVKSLQKKYSVKCGMVMGNHDVSHFKEYFQCAKKIIENDIEEENYKTCYVIPFVEDNIQVVFVNSCPVEKDGDNYKYGKIDYDSLELLLKKLPEGNKKILVLHHTIISMDENDISSIRNAAQMIRLINKYEIEAILHGHTHGKDTLLVGENGCNVIGVGAMFSRNNPDISSQFNLIKNNNGSILKVTNYLYQMDAKMENASFSKRDQKLKKETNFFCGETFEIVHKKLVERLSVGAPLYNVTLNIKNSFNVFSKSLESYLCDKKINRNGKEYDYIKLGEMWENINLPEELHFNHGMYLKVGDKPGIEYVIEALIKKRTSNRVGLFIGNKEKLVETAKTDAFFPSLINIQFGFDKNYDELHITMNLRALEVKRFLLINICEIKFLINEINNQFPFHNIDITINAFRVQAIENFGCFIKAEIDKLVDLNTNQDIYYEVSTNNYDQICKWLRGKRECIETVIVSEGIVTLHKSIKDFNQREGGKKYDDYILEQFIELINAYGDLREYRLSNSIEDNKIEEYEDKINDKLDVLINLFEELKKGN